MKMGSEMIKNLQSVAPPIFAAKEYITSAYNDDKMIPL